MSSTTTSRSRMRGLVAAVAVVAAGVVLAPQLIHTGEDESNGIHVGTRAGGREHVVRVDAASTANRTRVTGSAVSNRRGEIWRDDGSATRGRSDMPYRAVFVVYDDESVSVSVNVIVRSRDDEDEIRLTCAITVDGQAPRRGTAGLGQPERRSTTVPGVPYDIRCHHNWIGSAA